MTDKLTERIGIPLTTTMLEVVRASAKRNGRKVLDEIRYLIQRGLDTDAKRDVDARLKTIERDLQMIKETSPVYRSKGRASPRRKAG